MDSHSTEASAISAVENNSMSPDSFSSGDTITAELETNATSPEVSAEVVRLSFAIMLLWWL